MAITPLPQSDAVPERPIKILLVEDERALREALADALTSEGFVVTQAETGAAGLDAFRVATPDLILLDLMLPEMGGIEICRSIRSSSRVPIIMVTAKASETDRISGLDLGADDYVTKPFSMTQIDLVMKKIEQQIRKRHGKFKARHHSDAAKSKRRRQEADL